MLINLNGVFAKNERGVETEPKWNSVLIATNNTSIFYLLRTRRKCLKTPYALDNKIHIQSRRCKCNTIRGMCV